MRNRHQAAITIDSEAVRRNIHGHPSISKVSPHFPSAATGDVGVSRTSRRSWASSHASLPVLLPEDFFEKLAQLAAGDRELSARLSIQTLASRLEGGSVKVKFLQMCIRGWYLQCRDLWAMLSEQEQSEFMMLYRRGPPSHDYFLTMFLQEERPASDCGSSSSEAEI
jgi:hypothetical protein